LNGYLTFLANPDLRFDLDFIFPNADSVAVTLTDTATGVNLAWSMRTTALRLSTGETTCYTGTYSSQVNAMTSAELLAMLAGGGFIDTTYSGSFTPCPVPLPATAPLVLTGLTGLFWQVRRRRYQ